VAITIHSTSFPPIQPTLNKLHSINIHRTALRPELQNPSVWDPLSLGDSSFGQEAPFCKAYGDGSGGGDDDLGFWPGFLVGGAVVIGALFLISLAALIGLVYYHRRRSAYEQL